MTKPAFLLAALLAGFPAWAACPTGQAPMLQARLYFGLVADGKQVPDAAWQDFLRRAVEPRFPAGFTVYDATGRWRDARTMATGREPSKVIEIDAPDTREFRVRLEEVRKAYGARFHQQSVGLVTQAVCGAF